MLQVPCTCSRWLSTLVPLVVALTAIALAPVLRVVNLLNVVVCIVVTEMSGWNGFVVTGVLAIGNAIAIVVLSSGIIFGAIRCDRLA